MQITPKRQVAVINRRDEAALKAKRGDFFHALPKLGRSLRWPWSVDGGLSHRSDRTFTRVARQRVETFLLASRAARQPDLRSDPERRQGGSCVKRNFCPCDRRDLRDDRHIRFSNLA